MWPRCSGRWPGRRGSGWKPGERVLVGSAGRASWGGWKASRLPEVLRDMLKFSTNLTAECVGLTASGAAGLEASARVDVGLGAGERFGVAFEMHDHSGPWRAVAGHGGGDGAGAGPG